MGGGLFLVFGRGFEGGSLRCFWGEIDKVRCINVVNNRRDIFIMIGIIKVENFYF